MIIAFVIAVILLAASVFWNNVLYQKLLDEREKRFDAEGWIDPVVMSEDWHGKD